MSFLVVIGPADDLGIEQRIALADDGFSEAAQYGVSKAVWPEGMGWGSGLDIPLDLLEATRLHIVYRHEGAATETHAEQMARAIVGDDFRVRVYPMRSEQ